VTGSPLERSPPPVHARRAICHRSVCNTRRHSRSTRHPRHPGQRPGRGCPVSPKFANVRLKLRVILRRSEFTLRVAAGGVRSSAAGGFSRIGAVVSADSCGMAVVAPVALRLGELRLCSLGESRLGDVAVLQRTPVRVGGQVSAHGAGQLGFSHVAAWPPALPHKPRHDHLSVKQGDLRIVTALRGERRSALVDVVHTSADGPLDGRLVESGRKRLQVSIRIRREHGCSRAIDRVDLEPERATGL